MKNNTPESMTEKKGILKIRGKCLEKGRQYY